MEKDGPLDGRKTNKHNKDSPMGQVTPKFFYDSADDVWLGCPNDLACYF